MRENGGVSMRIKDTKSGEAGEKGRRWGGKRGRGREMERESGNAKKNLREEMGTRKRGK